ncbi:MAG: glycoside hydrolase family protein [Anaerolineae bacterium]
MLYRPSEHSMWDTWIYPHGDKFYLFYLQRRVNSRHEVPWYWDSFGLAVSEDLLHWREIGTILEQSPVADDWMGTGRTWQVGDRFLINYSEISQGAQRIRFAESPDLVHWTKLDTSYDLQPDPRWYVTNPQEQPEPWVHWDCLNPVPLDGGGWTGFVSSHSKAHPVGCRAVVGQALSVDGMHWYPAPPASNHSASVAEVSGTAQFGPRHYVFVSISERMGPRYDRFSNGRQGSGMWYWCSDRADGPYVPPEHDHLLQGARSDYLSAYFGTAFRLADRWLWSHHWGDGEGRLWLAPLKELVESEPWHLALRYWPGNDGLNGALVTDAVDAHRLSYPRPVAGRPLCATWSACEGILDGQAVSAIGLAVIDIPEVAGSGCMVTCDLILADNHGDGAGLFIGGVAEKPAEGLVALFNSKGRVLLGHGTMGAAAPCFIWEEECPGPSFPMGRVHLRAFICNDFVELYANEVWVCTRRLRPEEVFVGRIGLWIDRCRARLERMQVWQLSLADGPVG